jgi:hypothetical protein
VLAEVMGNYTLKARSFARIKLFNFISNSIVTVVGHYEKAQKVWLSPPSCSSFILDRSRQRPSRRFDTPGGCTSSDEQ